MTRNLYAQAIGRELGRQGISCASRIQLSRGAALVESRQYGVILLESSPAG